MNAVDLKEILGSWNVDVFRELYEQSPGSADGIEVNSSARIYRLARDVRCHCGSATGLKEFPEQLCHPHSRDSLAVGAILDDATAAYADQLEVVVAVGINYGQFDTSASNAIPNPANWAKTRMWRRLGLVLASLDRECFNGEIARRFPDSIPDFDGKMPKPFHLVAVNFFPWMTQSEWREIELNSISESLALRCWGYHDPSESIAKLIERIAAKAPGTRECVGEVPFVIFHGAGNAVPYLGVETVRRLMSRVFTNYVFCDNLSRPFKPTNATVLQETVPLTLLQKNVHRVEDE